MATFKSLFDHFIVRKIMEDERRHWYSSMKWEVNNPQLIKLPVHDN